MNFLEIDILFLDPGLNLGCMLDPIRRPVCTKFVAKFPNGLVPKRWQAIASSRDNPDPR